MQQYQASYRPLTVTIMFKVDSGQWAVWLIDCTPLCDYYTGNFLGNSTQKDCREHQGGGVGSVIANHRGGGANSVTVTALDIVRSVCINIIMRKTNIKRTAWIDIATTMPPH